MHRLNELAAKLTPTQVKEVEDFAEFLLSRSAAAPAKEEDKFLDVDSFAGMFAGLAPEKSDVELADEATEIISAKYAKHFE